VGQFGFNDAALLVLQTQGPCTVCSRLSRRVIRPSSSATRRECPAGPCIPSECLVRSCAPASGPWWKSCGEFAPPSASTGMTFAAAAETLR